MSTLLTVKAETPDVLLVWNFADVMEVIEAAGRQLRQLPDTDRRWVTDVRAFWPDTTQDTDEVRRKQWDLDLARLLKRITEAELDGADWVSDPLQRHLLADDVELHIRVIATLEDATALEAFLDWIWWVQPGMKRQLQGFYVVIPSDIRGILIHKAMGKSLRYISKLRRGRGSHEQTRRLYLASVSIIADRLNRE